ncbi:hypothetical protein [Nesterenkonia suensis]
MALSTRSADPTAILPPALLRSVGGSTRNRTEALATFSTMLMVLVVAAGLLSLLLAWRTTSGSRFGRGVATAVLPLSLLALLASPWAGLLVTAPSLLALGLMWTHESSDHVRRHHTQRHDGGIPANAMLSPRVPSSNLGQTIQQPPGL